MGQSELYMAALEAMRTTRKDLFGAVDKQLPISELKDAVVPQIGFVGQDYRQGGIILFGINPGGGGDSYMRTAEDALLLPLIMGLRDGETSPAALKVVFDQYAANMRTWNLWRVAAPVLDACGSTQSEIAYLNWCPFRTRSDQMPHAHVMRRSHEAYLAPLIRQLAPSRIIALGKKVGTWLEKLPVSNAALYVIPRTIGDSYLCEEARVQLEALKGSSRQLTKLR